MLNLYCKLQMELNDVYIAFLFTIVYCPEPTKQYWDRVRLKTLSPGAASRILVTQATATALLSCRNATCGFRIYELPD